MSGWPEALDGGVGAVLLDDGMCRFRVWAPYASSVAIRLLAPGRNELVLERTGGYWESVAEAPAGDYYLVVLDGEALPDPASRHQPLGVDGPSAIVDASFGWTDSGWAGIALDDYVISEIHVGTFTDEGTLDAAIQWLGELARVGITAVELMPVAQFPGTRNWGYDGVFPYAIQHSYGGPEALKRFVDASHSRGLAVVLDVVYNHLGPEGNVLPRFGPYFTGRYATPWGAAMNFDGPGSDEVRQYFGGTARQWLEDFHVDALRLDAIDEIVDTSATPFLAELAEATDTLSAGLGRPLYLIAESASNDPRVCAPTDRHGLGMHAQWNDDFNHSVHALVSGERAGYYGDYGEPEHVAKALRDGFVYDGRHSRHRGHRYGAPAGDAHPARMVVFARNHDQVGNRQFGERLTTTVGFEELKVVAAAVLTAPSIPLLFMGEEYGEVAPFLYFVDHADPGLLEAVREGRKSEFAAFEWRGDPPDPADEATYHRSKIDQTLRTKGDHARLQAFYGEALLLRRTQPALRSRRREHLDVEVLDRVVVTTRRGAGARALVLLSFASGPVEVPLSDGEWLVALDSSNERWGGPRRDCRDRVSGALEVGPSSAVVVLRI